MWCRRRLVLAQLMSLGVAALSGALVSALLQRAPRVYSSLALFALLTLFLFVVLRTQSSAQPVEIAFIRIPLEAFAPALRRRFIEAEQPFGTLLAEAGIRFHAHPQAYFTCEADAMLAQKCGLSEGTRLYGRVNQLLRDDGVLLCETVEALPCSPLADRET